MPASEVENLRRPKYDGVQDQHGEELAGFDPQNLPDEKVFKMLGAMWVVAEQDDFCAGGDDED